MSKLTADNAGLKLRDVVPRPGRVGHFLADVVV
jgi:hypothetical protein